jgi:hypothetical protein
MKKIVTVLSNRILTKYRYGSKYVHDGGIKHPVQSDLMCCSIVTGLQNTLVNLPEVNFKSTICNKVEKK